MDYKNYKMAFRTERNEVNRIKIKMRLYIKTTALVLLVGGATIYNLITDSLAATEISREIAFDYPERSNIDIHRRNLSNSGNCVAPAEPKELALAYVIGILYLFIGLAIIADDFFCPSLDVLADWMKLSPDVSGATLMAAGSSAPELFTSAVGTFLRSDVGFGTIVGSAVFNLLFVVGVCVLATKVPMNLTWWPLMRDSSFYILTLIVLAVFFGVNSPQVIEWYEALTLFLLYFLYVFVMYKNEALYRFVSGLLANKNYALSKVGSEKTGLDEEKKRLDDEANNLFNGNCKFRTGILNMLMTNKSLVECAGTAMVSRISGTVEDVFKKFDTDKSGWIDAAELKQVFEMLHCEADEASLALAMTQLDKDGNGTIDIHEFSLWWISSESRMRAQVMDCFNAIDIEHNGFITVADIAIMLKNLGHPAVPETEMRIALSDVSGKNSEHVSLPEFEAWYERSMFWKAHKDRAHNEQEASEGISLSPPVDAGWFTWFWYIVTFPLVFMFWCTVADVRKPGNRKYAHLTFVMCLCWMGFFSYFMVSWVETVGATAGIPSVIMGLTFLAAGTSVPDMFSAVIVAQQGFGDKAVSSTIGSNVFDINVALGLPWLLFIIIYQESVIVIADGFLISIIILFVTLFALILTVRLVNWSLPKWTGYFFIFLYCVFVAQQLGRTDFSGVC